MYLPAIVMVGFYFENRRAFATGVAVCGSGIGGFIFAPLCEMLLRIYGWKGATWIIGGICLNGMLFGALFRPLEQNKSKKKSKDIDNQCAENSISIIADNKTLQSNFERKSSIQSTDSGQTVGQNYDPIESPEQNCKVHYKEINIDEMNKRTNAQSAPAQERNIFHKNLNKDSKSSLVSDSADRGVTLLSVQTFTSNSYSNKAFPARLEDIKTKEVTPVDSSHVILEEKTGCLGKCVRNKYMDFTILINPVFAVYGLPCFMVMAGKCLKQYAEIIIRF